ncbi:hypothetical protein [Phycobacter sp. K97]|uniref:hypothetical protein n=1 Tax=Phycobacter sedimenti TaxID=3133977 RepID=UPI00311E7817
MTDTATISACENVCHDFSWLAAFADWSPVFAAIVAAVGAWIVAKQSYVVEKRADREKELLTEKRSALKDLLALRQSALYVRKTDVREANEFDRLWASASLVQLFCEEPMRDAVRRYLGELNTEISSLTVGETLADQSRLSPEFLNAHHDLLDAAVKELRT